MMRFADSLPWKSLLQRRGDRGFIKQMDEFADASQVLQVHLFQFLFIEFVRLPESAACVVGVPDYLLPCAIFL